MNEKKEIPLTGAAGVIGRAMARRLARAGYHLHLTSRDPAKLKNLVKDLASEGIASDVYALELGDAAQTEDVVRHFVEKAKAPYGLICNAGNLGALGSFLETDFDQWRKSLDENFLSHARMIRVFAQALGRRNISSGAIVVMSGAGLGGNSSFAQMTSYSTAKAALTHFVEAVAPELAPLGLTINAVSPGQVLSGLTEEA